MNFAVTNLRVRLILAFSALVSLVLFVGVVSYHINEQVRADVDDLRPSDRVDLNGIDLGRQGVEFEGAWSPRGAFIASKVMAGPEPVRPKLRGQLQDVSQANRTITMYGVVIHVTDETVGDQHASGAAEPLKFGALARGVRAEVLCRVDEATGTWFAKQIELSDVKVSDKIKGMVTKADLDGVPPESVEIDGLKIVLQALKESGPESAFGHIEKATEMLRALQECRAAAHAAVLGGISGAPGLNSGASDNAASEMERQATRFENLLQDAGANGAEATLVPPGRCMQYLSGMSKRVHLLPQHIARLEQLIRDRSVNEALEYLSTDLESYLDTDLLPFVYAYLNTAEEELGDELRGVLDRTQTTTRVALATSVVAVLVAIVLGIIVWRSIHRPIRQLHDAAIALGQGRLETRIAISSRDELGVLAAAFNSMAGQLATSTVSVASLGGLFDSMAAGVILCDKQGIVTKVNRAARELVFRSNEDFVGQAFASVCRLSHGELLSSMVQASTAAGGSLERILVRKDGRDLPVSLSVAELRTAGESLEGFVFVAQDLTPIKHVEAQLRQSLAEKELLLREVHHRVKNNMQVISSLLAMQSTAVDPEVRPRLEESQNRIRTIALIHDQLYQSSELAHIDTRSYLNVLATHLLDSFGMTERVRLELDIDTMDLDVDQSLACGLIVNELLTNSLKYAFPGNRHGTIRLELKNRPDGKRLLRVSDDGCGMNMPEPGLSAHPLRKTLGTSLIAQLARQLRGKVDTTNANGVTVAILFAGLDSPQAVKQ